MAWFKWLAHVRVNTRSGSCLLVTISRRAGARSSTPVFAALSVGQAALGITNKTNAETLIIFLRRGEEAGGAAGQHSVPSPPPTSQTHSYQPCWCHVSPAPGCPPARLNNILRSQQSCCHGIFKALMSFHQISSLLCGTSLL